MATEDELRRTALALPQVTEGTWYGTPGYLVAGRGFLRLRTRDEGALVVCVADEGEKRALLESNPTAFFTTPHYDGSAIVLVVLDAVDPAELAELVTESWRLKAPKRLVAAFDADAEVEADGG